MKIVLTGGGTAGHIQPNLAILGELRKKYDKIVYIGSTDGMESSLIKNESDLTFYPIKTTKFVRGKIFVNLLIPFRLIKSIHSASKILKQEKPNIVFSKGGYVALPVVLAARRRKIPVIIHESDLSMGLSNKLSRRAAVKILTTFEDPALKEKKGVYVGSPMKKNMFISREAARKKLNITSSKPVLVVTGGSLGSKFINKKIRDEINELTKTFYVIHLTGRSNLEPRLNNFSDYRQIEFTSDMGSVLSVADVVVSRAGSNTIFELAALKKPMLLIPLPKGSSRGDQVDNAKYFNGRGYADFVSEDRLNSEPITKFILSTYRDRETLINNLKNANFTPANEKIVDILVKYSKKD